MTTEKKAAPLALGYDPAMQVPLVGQEGYRHPDSGSDFIDERFAPLDNSGSGAGSRALKAFIEEQVAEQTPATVVHVSGEPFRVFYDKSTWRATGTLARMKYSFTGKDREEVLDKLVTLGQRVQAESVHELTREEKMRVVRTAQAGDTTGAIALFCELAIGQERASQYASPNEMLADSALEGVFDEAALLTWFSSHSNVQDSTEWNTFLQNYAGGRPYTHQLLSGAWSAFREEQYKRTPLLPHKKEDPATSREIAAGLEEMTDEQINKQFWATARHVARSGR